MKKISILFGWLMIMMLISSCSEEVLELDQAKLDDKKSKLQNREFVSESLIPNYIGNSEYRQMQIYTPPGYSKHGTQRYPVVYLLHGLPFSEKAFLRPQLWESWIVPPMPFLEGAPDFPIEGFREWMDGLIASGTIEPMIVVMPNAANNMYGFSMYTNSVLNGGFENYIVYDLVKYIDDNYMTIASKEGRSLVGTSQGGYAAIKLGMLHPDKFSVVASHTGLLFIDMLLAPEMVKLIMDENPDGLQGPHPDKFLTSAIYAFGSAWSPNLLNPPYYVDLPFDQNWNLVPEVWLKWKSHDVFTMLDNPDYRNNVAALNGVYLDAGSKDELQMFIMAQAFAQKMAAYNLNFEYHDFEGGHFNRIFSRMEESLKFCSDRMNP